MISCLLMLVLGILVLNLAFSISPTLGWILIVMLVMIIVGNSD